MKKPLGTVLSVLALAWALQPTAFAQSSHVEIIPIAGYQWGGGANTREGELNIKGNPQYGIALDYYVTRESAVELSYTRQDTELESRTFGGIRETLFDMSVEYFQIGGLRTFKSGRFQPFGMFTLGATRFAPKDVGVGDEWRFSTVLSLGGKFMATERIGLRLHGQLLMPFINGGGGFFCGGGAGCSVGIGGTAMVQGNVGGGDNNAF